MNKFNIPVSSNTWVHITSNNGLRFSALDRRLNEILVMPEIDPRASSIGPMIAPLVVIESEKGYQAVWADTDPEIRVDQEKMEISGKNLQVSGYEKTLKEAAKVYLGKNPLPPKIASDRPHRFSRAINLDMFLPEGRIVNTYADAVRLVEDLAKRDLSNNTILYLNGWCGHYDAIYPQYKPAEALGGSKGLHHLMEASRKYGVTVLLHVNYWGYDESTGLLPDYNDYRVYDDQGSPMGYAGITWSGATNPLAYMRVDDPRWTKVWFGYIDPLIEEYGIQALFLDQIGLTPDDGIRQGTIDMLKRLHATHPGIILGGEMLKDFLLPYVDIYTDWGAPWCGIVGDDLTTDFSPIIRHLFAEQAVFMGHMGFPSAVPCRYNWTNMMWILEHGIEEAFMLAQEYRNKLGGIPHVHIPYCIRGIDPLSLKVLKGELKFTGDDLPRHPGSRKITDVKDEI